MDSAWSVDYSWWAVDGPTVGGGTSIASTGEIYHSGRAHVKFCILRTCFRHLFLGGRHCATRSSEVPPPLRLLRASPIGAPKSSCRESICRWRGNAPRAPVAQQEAHDIFSGAKSSLSSCFSTTWHPRSVLHQWTTTIAERGPYSVSISSSASPHLGKVVEGSRALYPELLVEK